MRAFSVTPRRRSVIASSNSRATSEPCSASDIRISNATRSISDTRALSNSKSNRPCARDYPRNRGAGQCLSESLRAHPGTEVPPLSVSLPQLPVQLGHPVDSSRLLAVWQRGDGRGSRQRVQHLPRRREAGLWPATLDSLCNNGWPFGVSGERRGAMMGGSAFDPGQEARLWPKSKPSRFLKRRTSR